MITAAARANWNATANTWHDSQIVLTVTAYLALVHSEDLLLWQEVLIIIVELVKFDVILDVYFSLVIVIIR